MNAVIKQRYAHTTSVVGDWIYLIAGARERTYLRGVMRIPSGVLLSHICELAFVS